MNTPWKVVCTVFANKTHSNLAIINAQELCEDEMICYLILL